MVHLLIATLYLVRNLSYGHSLVSIAIAVLFMFLAIRQLARRHY